MLLLVPSQVFRVLPALLTVGSGFLRLGCSLPAKFRRPFSQDLMLLLRLFQFLFKPFSLYNGVSCCLLLLFCPVGIFCVESEQLIRCQILQAGLIPQLPQHSFYPVSQSFHLFSLTPAVFISIMKGLFVIVSSGRSGVDLILGRHIFLPPAGGRVMDRAADRAGYAVFQPCRQNACLAGQKALIQFLCLPGGF